MHYKTLFSDSEHFILILNKEPVPNEMAMEIHIQYDMRVSGSQNSFTL